MNAVKSSLYTSLRIKVSLYQTSLKWVERFNRESVTERHSYFQINDITMDVLLQNYLMISNITMGIRYKAILAMEVTVNLQIK